ASASNTLLVGSRPHLGCSPVGGKSSPLSGAIRTTVMTSSRSPIAVQRPTMRFVHLKSVEQHRAAIENTKGAQCPSMVPSTPEFSYEPEARPRRGAAPGGHCSILGD